MYRKKETEFQYAPGIDLILEDVQGGGTVARAAVKAVIDELPPLVVVCKDSNGLYQIVKTAKVVAVAGATDVAYHVEKGHLLVVGEVITNGGLLAKAAKTIASIDKTNADYDIITLNATIAAAAIGDVLVLANAEAAAGAAAFKYVPEAITMNKIDTTVANQQSGLLVRGTVRESVMPYPVDAAIKAKLNHIRFV